MNLTGKQIISDVRIRVQELRPDKFPDAVLLHWANLAQIWVVQETECLEAIDSQNTTADKAVYDLPTDCVKPTKVTYGSDNISPPSSTLLTEMSELELDLANPSWSAETGTPTYWMQRADKFVLTPTPNTVHAISVFYVKTPTDISSTSDTADLPVDYQELIVLDVQRKALSALGKTQESSVVTQELLGRLQSVKKITEKIWQQHISGD